jgi:hypothetical protein
MEQTECSETSAHKIQTPGNYPEENIQHTEHGESLKSKILQLLGPTVKNFQTFQQRCNNSEPLWYVCCESCRPVVSWIVKTFQHTLSNASNS